MKPNAKSGNKTKLALRHIISELLKNKEHEKQCKRKYKKKLFTIGGKIKSRGKKAIAQQI